MSPSRDCGGFPDGKEVSFNLIIFKMPKVKTNSGAKKRFRLTGSGKIKRKHAYKRHILTKKTTKQKRNLTHFGLVDSADTNNVKMLLNLK